MGRKKVILRLLAACLTCAIVLRLLNDDALSPARRMRRGRLIATSLRDVNQVSLTLSDGRKVALRADDDGWVMTEPRNAPALTPAVQQLLDAFEQAPLHEYIDEEEVALRELTSADFGFDNPVGQIALRAPSFGIKLTVGDSDAVTNGLFVSFDADGGVCVTDPSLREFFLKSPLDYADRRVFRGSMRMVHTIVLRRPTRGDVKLVRDTARRQWLITQPMEARADWDSVGRLFSVLTAATVIDDFTSDSAIPAGALDQGDAPSITLFSKNDLVGQTLVLGDSPPGNADITYARSANGVFTVTGAVRRIVLAPAHDFRDRRLFPASTPISVQSLSLETAGNALSLRRAQKGWTITAPVSDNAEPGEVAALIDAILDLRAERFAPFDGKDAPPRLATVSVGSTQGRFAFDVHGELPDFPGRAGILPEGSDTLFVVSASTVSNILGRCRDPRPLLSRTVLAVDEEHVRAVTLSRPGTPDERIEKVGGEWAAAAPGRLVDEPTVRRFFAAAAEIRAETVAALAPTNALPLDGGSEITFDLDDGTALRRVLTIGPRLGSGHPAGVKGRDAVFLLPPETASILTRPFYTVEAAATGESPTPSPATEPESK